MKPLHRLHHGLHLALLGASLLLCPLGASAALCAASASVMSFGIYDPIDSNPNDTTATVQVTCTPAAGNPLTTPYTITVAGTGTGNDSVRSISLSSNRLYYQVYKDSGRGTLWGNTLGTGLASSVTSSAVLVPASRTHTAYARMSAHQNVAAGTYAGTLLVTVDY